MTTSTPPNWPHCGHGADPDTDPIGCRGIHVLGHTACLAHLELADRDAHFDGLQPGDDVDHRGTTFDEELLRALLAALHDPDIDAPKLGDAAFSEVTFSGDAEFGRATFSGGAEFNGATFSGDAEFNGATFSGITMFGLATFSGNAEFSASTFSGIAMFNRATFSANAEFGLATFGGDAMFNRATFSRSAGFNRATFSRSAGFNSATFSRRAGFRFTTFSGNAEFSASTFSGIAMFNSAIFSLTAWFRGATFSANADFGLATFSRNAEFGRATVSGDVGFGRATFSGNAEFGRATISGDVGFRGATFQSAQSLGRFVCRGSLDLSRAVFAAPVTLEAAANRVECERTQWEHTATLRLRHATLDLTDAVLTQPVAVTAHPAPFGGTPPLDETGITWSQRGVSVESLRGVDCAMLSLSDVDLSPCRFSGTFHLDQLRLEGRYLLPTTPSGVHWRGCRPVRWTPRRTLAEEQHWRATRSTGTDGWTSAPRGVAALAPVALAPVYRQLRKAFEDSKAEPGAADFYYGEMEMRRHADDIPRSERALLTTYWALSGYGLRAARALGWLAIAMTGTILLMMGFGLPNESPKQEITRERVDGHWKTIIDKPDPRNPTGDRFTGKRFEKALNVTLNSVVFRSSGQDLTTAGTYIEMTSRLTEPILLGFAGLAVRGRVKRGS
ncbi:pentapeptide repeat-containing protein [Streptomyces inhibens]|uniref:pentapeptide repeat-containing protein n=1 Tax=Streptomyces inhibens TaxID=2293571 RepID=UPI0036B3C482